VYSIREKNSKQIERSDALHHVTPEPDFLLLDDSLEDLAQIEIVLLVYSEPRCRGSVKTIDLSYEEKRCTGCLDLCTEGVREEIKSVEVLGNTVVSVYSVCIGNFPYMGDAEFVTTLTMSQGCVDTPNEWVFFRLLKIQPRVEYLPSPALPHVRIVEWVSQTLLYWKKHASGIIKSGGGVGEKFLTFLTDCGEFDEIRMSFEHAVLIAWVTGRTLVLPLPGFWHLLGDDDEGESQYDMFFDLDSLREGLPIIDSKNFLASRGWAKAKFNDENEYKHFLETFGTIYTYNPKSHALVYPSIKAYTAAMNQTGHADNLFRLGNRELVELTDAQKEAEVLHLPTCRIIDSLGHESVRYLGQISTTVFFARENRESVFKNFFHDNVHYTPFIFEAAAGVIATLGLFQYSCFHIQRRNVQWASSIVSGNVSLRNTENLLNFREPIYIATDELDINEFSAFRKNRKVYSYQDFMMTMLSKRVTRIQKGLIEQVICAGARRFFGTERSPYSSYVYRLRGYLNAPDLHQYSHTVYYTGDPRIDEIAEAKNGSPYYYTHEDPSMWLDIT